MWVGCSTRLRNSQRTVQQTQDLGVPVPPSPRGADYSHQPFDAAVRMIEFESADAFLLVQVPLNKAGQRFECAST